MNGRCTAVALCATALLAVALAQGQGPPTPVAPPTLGQAQQIGQTAGDAASTAVAGTVAAISAFGGPNATVVMASTTAAVNIQSAFGASASALMAGLLEIAGEVQNCATGLTNSLVTLLTAPSNPREMATMMAQAAQVFGNRARQLAGQVTQAAIVFASAFVQSSVMVTNACGSCSATVVSSAFAIQLGGTVEANAYASANCTVTCVAASQNALNNGALESASAGAASAAALTLYSSTAVATGASRAVASVGNVSTTSNSTVMAATRAVRVPIPPRFTPGQRATLAALLQGSNCTAGANRYAVGVGTRQPAPLLMQLQGAAMEATTIAQGFVNSMAAAGATPSSLTFLNMAANNAMMATQQAAAGNVTGALSGIASMAGMQTMALNQAAQAIAQAPVAPAPGVQIRPTEVPNVARGVPAPATTFSAQVLPPTPVLVAPTVSTAALNQAIAPLAQPPRATPRSSPPSAVPPTPPPAMTTPVLPRSQAPAPSRTQPPTTG